MVVSAVGYSRVALYCLFGIYFRFVIIFIVLFWFLCVYGGFYLYFVWRCCFTLISFIARYMDCIAIGLGGSLIWLISRALWEFLCGSYMRIVYLRNVLRYVDRASCYHVFAWFFALAVLAGPSGLGFDFLLCIEAVGHLLAFVLLYLECLLFGRAGAVRGLREFRAFGSGWFVA